MNSQIVYIIVGNILPICWTISLPQKDLLRNVKHFLFCRNLDITIFVKIMKMLRNIEIFNLWGRNFRVNYWRNFWSATLLIASHQMQLWSMLYLQECYESLITLGSGVVLSMLCLQECYESLITLGSGVVLYMLCLQECYESLISLLSWSWSTFCSFGGEVKLLQGMNLKAAILDLQQLVYISTASLRLIRTYIHELYPWQGKNISILCLLFVLSS